MESFDRLNLHQIEWRKANVASMGLGRWRGREYPWVLPESSWEEGLWLGIRSGWNNSLPAIPTPTPFQAATERRDATTVATAQHGTPAFRSFRSPLASSTPPGYGRTGQLSAGA